MKKTITIFGSSIPVTGEEQYESAYKLGCILAKNNLNICSGGNLGIMEAVSKGAVENGAEAIGITLKNSFGIHNQYLTEHILCDTLFERISMLVNRGDAYIILQGGTGTLLELAVVWEFMNKNMLELKPVACHAKMWEPIIGKMEEQIFKEKRKTGLVKYFSNIEPLCEYIISETIK